MKRTRVFALCVALAGASPSVLFAQTTNESGILGPSGDPVYPLAVQGADGVVYHCKQDTITRNGRVERPCRRKGASLQSGDALGAPAVFGGLGALLLLGLAAGSSSGTD